jgi:hypothetical protein
VTARAKKRRRRRSRGAGTAAAVSTQTPAPFVFGLARRTAAVVGFVATVVGLIFVLWPSLKPEGPPPERGARLENLTLDQPLTFGQYLDRKELSKAPYGPAELERRGAYVEFDYTIEGYKDKLLPLRWQLIDAGSHQQVAQSRDIRIKPLAPTDQGSWEVWIPIPRDPARSYFVQIELFNDAGSVPLRRLRTDPFAAAG